MRDVTEKISLWINCSNDLWTSWFSTWMKDVDRFEAVEEVLFKEIVLEELEMLDVPDIKTFRGLVKARYRESSSEFRQVCSIQKSGTIFCESSPMKIDTSALYRIRDFDPLGTMMGGKPYVEVWHGDVFTIENLDGLTFFIDEK